jgi:hypothetical protein
MISRIPAGMMGIVAALLIAGATSVALTQQQRRPAREHRQALKVATVKLEQGLRASKLIGTAVYNEQNTEIGSVDNLLLIDEDKVAVAIISVGGFLGIGSKLVPVPYDQLHRDKQSRVL